MRVVLKPYNMVRMCWLSYCIKYNLHLGRGFIMGIYDRTIIEMCAECYQGIVTRIDQEDETYLVKFEGTDEDKYVGSHLWLPMSFFEIVHEQEAE